MRGTLIIHVSEMTLAVVEKKCRVFDSGVETGSLKQAPERYERCAGAKRDHSSFKPLRRAQLDRQRKCQADAEQQVNSLCDLKRDNPVHGAVEQKRQHRDRREYKNQEADRHVVLTNASWQQHSAGQQAAEQQTGEKNDIGRHAILAEVKYRSTGKRGEEDNALNKTLQRREAKHETQCDNYTSDERKFHLALLIHCTGPGRSGHSIAHVDTRRRVVPLNFCADDAVDRPAGLGQTP